MIILSMLQPPRGLRRAPIAKSPLSEVDRIEPIEPGMGADRDLAQRGPGAVFSAGVDGRRPLRSDRRLPLIGIIEKNFHRVLALGDVRIGLLEFWNLVARKVLSDAIAPPDTV